MNYVYVIILSLATIALSAACGSSPPDGSGGDGGGTSSHSSTTGTSSPASTGTGEVLTCPADYPTECIGTDGEGQDVLCVDLQTDPQHCGSCENDCNTGNTTFFSCDHGVCPTLDGGTN